MALMMSRHSLFRLILPVFSFLAVLSYAENAPASSDFPLRGLGLNHFEDLSGQWLFRFDADDRGIDGEWYLADADRSAWARVAVPGIWDQAPGEISLSCREGVGWFARELQVPEDWTGEMAFCFLGVMYVADVWFDGEYLGLHRGGYTPFLLEADKLRPGAGGTLVIRVDNRLSRETVPNKHLGWQPYGGIFREVYLVSRPELRVDGVHSVVRVNLDGAVRLEIRGALANHGVNRFPGELMLHLREGGKLVYQAPLPFDLERGGRKDFAFEINLSDARLWSPDDPFLYDLELVWTGAASGRIEMPLALREIRVSGGGLYLNNKRLWLQGFGEHEGLAGFGPIFPAGYRERELRLLKEEYKINHIRTGHYPHHPRVYAECDKLGILAFVEIPVWQCDRSWIQTDRAWEEWLAPQLRDMVEFYRNFGSIVSWGAANEMGGTARYNERAVAYLRELDASRLPMIVIAATGDMSLYGLLPMAGRNYHYGWYHSKRVYDGLRGGYARNLEEAEKADIPIWVAELGGQARPGRFSGAYNDRSRGSETYLDKLVRFGFQYCATQDERVCGVAIWTWSDFTRGGSINHHGIVGYDREPKLVSYTVRNLFEGAERLYLCEEDSSCKAGGDFIVTPYLFRPGIYSSGLAGVDSAGSAISERKLKVRWRIVRGMESLAEGSFPVVGGAGRSTRLEEIRWSIPHDAMGFHSLWVELFDDDGKWLYTNSVHFGLARPERPGILRLRILEDGEPQAGRVEIAGLSLAVYRHPGLLIPLREGSYRLRVVSNGEDRELSVDIRPGQATDLIIEAEDESTE